MNISNTQLFRGVTPEQVPRLLTCLNAQERRYQKGETILAEGSISERFGMVLSGMAVMSTSDVWGHTSVLGNAAPGAVFGEVYACIPGQPLLVTVSAAEDTTVLLLDVRRVLTTCAHACPFHTQLVQNLLTVCAHRNLLLSQRIMHTSPKTIRGRLMSYFSDCAKRAGSDSFLIPYNRQQLADYLNVDRSALSNELSKMQRDGLIAYTRNRVTLKG